MTAQPNQSLINGITCLQTVVAAGHPIGSREVSRLLQDDHTRTSRLLSTLASIGLLEKTPQRKYQPGPALHVLAAQSLHGSMLLTCALPHLAKLMNRGMTVALGVLWQRQVCFLFHCKPGQPLEESIGRHQLHPADRSSVGLALLAHSTPEPKHRFPRTVWEAEPTMPVTNLDPVLLGVKRLGYARLRFADRGILSVGLPLGNPPFAALALSGPWEASETPRVVSLLQETAAAILADLATAHSQAALKSP